MTRQWLRQCGRLPARHLIKKLTTKNNDGPRKYSVAEAKDYLGICERTLRYLIAQDGIKYYRRGGIKRGRLFFLETDLQAHLFPTKKFNGRARA